MEGNNKTYSSVPPPASLISNAPVDFNNALSKARAIAEKLKQQAAASAAPSVGGPSYASVGSKRGYREGSSEDDKHHARSSRPYARDEHDSKRSSYDSYGRPSSSSRYGGGSDDRKHTTHHNDMSSSSSSLQEECTVPNHMVGLVIGKGGDNLKKIERMSGAKVQFTGDSGDLERRVNIVGEPEQTKIAREMIQQVVDDAYVCEASRMSRPTPSANATGAGMSETATAPLTTFSSGGSNLIITIPSGKVGLVIGRGGETIRDLEERSGAKITVAPEPSSDRPSQRSVNLIGDAHAVQRAKALIDDIVSEDSLKSVTPSRDWAAYRQQHYPAGESGHGRRDEEESDTHRKEGSDTALGSGSGSGSGGGGGGGSGSGAGYPSFATGANAPFDRYGPSSSSQHQDRGYNSGSTSTSGGATTGANTSGGDHRAGIGFRNRFSDERESIQVPKNAVGFLIGRGGETVRSLQDQSGARIKVDSTGDVDGNERTINIFGSTEAIALAKQLVMEKVAEGNVSSVYTNSDSLELD
ncbi:hypothetical protein BDF14DRAFT_1513278 [Spinellus fusiger]|nr:hypothetical protein BDF14DRAFT_1513278 [Spinellus fusiger]